MTLWPATFPKEQFYKKSQQESHLEPHPLEKSLEETIFELKNLLDEAREMSGTGNPEFFRFLAYVDVIQDGLRDTGEKLAKIKLH